MKLKLCLLMGTLLSAPALFAQTTVKNKKVTLDLDKVPAYTRAISYFGDSITVIRKGKQALSFAAKTDMSTSAFFNKADLSKAAFNKKAAFSEATFYGDADFHGSTFKDLADFSVTSFQHNADLSHCKFLSSANFFRAAFHRKADLTGSEFSTLANFSNLIILSDTTTLVFKDARLPPVIDLSYNDHFPHPVDLTVANNRPAQLHYINLVGTDIPKVKIDHGHFRLCFYSKIDFRGHDAAMQKYFSNTADPLSYLRTPASYNATVANTAVKAYLNHIFPGLKVTDPAIKAFLSDCLITQWFPGIVSDKDITDTYNKVIAALKTTGKSAEYKAFQADLTAFKSKKPAN